MPSVVVVGMVSTWSTLILFGSVIPLVSINKPSGMPNVLAMPPKVAPADTVNVVAGMALISLRQDPRCKAERDYKNSATIGVA